MNSSNRNSAFHLWPTVYFPKLSLLLPKNNAPSLFYASESIIPIKTLPGCCKYPANPTKTSLVSKFISVEIVLSPVLSLSLGVAHVIEEMLIADVVE